MATRTPVDIVLAIRRDGAAGITPKEIAIMRGLSLSHVHRILNGTTAGAAGGPLRAKGRQLAADAAPEEFEREARQRLMLRMVVADNGCWLRTGRSINQEGYGLLSIGGRRMHAHRLSYLAFVGPIPAGCVIDHQCHNLDVTCQRGNDCLHRRCVNPDHLIAVSHRDNVRSGRRWADHALRSHCAKGHPVDEVNSRLVLLPSGGYRRRCRACDAGWRGGGNLG